MKRSGWSKVSRHERGYGSEWTKLRLHVLQRDCGLCRCPECTASGRITIATEVHHIKSKAECARLRWTQAQTDHPDNLQAINATCHRKITAAEQGRELKTRPTIGLDGFPV